MHCDHLVQNVLCNAVLPGSAETQGEKVVNFVNFSVEYIPVSLVQKV